MLLTDFRSGNIKPCVSKYSRLENICGARNVVSWILAHEGQFIAKSRNQSRVHLTAQMPEFTPNGFTIYLPVISQRPVHPLLNAIQEQSRPFARVFELAFAKPIVSIYPKQSDLHIKI